MARGYSQAKSPNFYPGEIGNPRDELGDDGVHRDDEGNAWKNGVYVAGPYKGQRLGQERETYEPNYEGQAMVKHIKTGERTEAALKALTPEETPIYKAARKSAVAAFDAAEEKSKTDWQAANPGKEYAGKPRQGFVKDGLKAVTDLLIANKVDAKIADLVVKKIGYDKDKFLRIKGHYGSNYEHINIPSIA